MSTSHERGELLRALTTASWLTYAAWLMFLFRQVARATTVTAQQFGGVWDQRIEVMSFVVLPPNALILVPAAGAAATASWLAGADQTLDLAIQLRMIRWSAIFQGFLAVASILSIVVNETGSPTEAQDLSIRVAGLATCAAIAVLLRTIERLRPGREIDPGSND